MIEQLIARTYGDFIKTRDVDAALESFTQDAEWHPVTPHPWRHASIPIRSYWEDSAVFLDGDGRSWSVIEQHVHVHGPFVIVHARSTHGEGLMVYRVEGDKITDVWAIDAAGRAATGLF